MKIPCFCKWTWIYRIFSLFFFNLGPSSYPKIENSKKFILLSRVNSLIPTYTRNLTELTTRFFSRRFLQFYDRIHEAIVVTAFTCLAKLQAVTPFTDAVQGGVRSQGRIHEIRDRKCGLRKRGLHKKISSFVSPEHNKLYEGTFNLEFSSIIS